METALKETHFEFPQQTAFYRGKVRDVYTIGEEILVMIATDRISAFDVVLPSPIPFKGQVLNQIAARFLEETQDIVPNWVLAVPDPNVTIGYACRPFKVEMVIRGYLSGHAWRTYQMGERDLCGVTLPEGLRENDRLPQPIITPTTKAGEGHDADITREQIIKRGIVEVGDYLKMEEYTKSLYERGTELARQRGLILVDAKYEFGKRGEHIYLIDEIHTPDSSRYFYESGYGQRQTDRQPQKQLSKEFVRLWLIENGFQGKEGEHIPYMSEAKITSISNRYIELYENILGEKFISEAKEENMKARIEKNIRKALLNI